MKKVLFICTRNSARSQMAEAYLRRFGGEEVEVESAGLEPGALNPFAVRALLEDGIDISGKVPQSVFELHRQGRRYHYVVAVCSREAAERCPIFPGAGIRLHWSFDDPSAFTGPDGQVMARVREVRDAIRERVRQFAGELRGA